MNVPTPIINMLKNKISPEMIVKQMAGNNPILANAIKMAESGDTAGVEKFARNICEQRGISYDDKLAELKSYFK